MDARTQLALALGLSLLACAPNAFRVDVKGETTVPSGTGPLSALPTVAGFSAIDLEEHPALQTQGLRREQISSLQVVGAKLRVLSPPEQGLAFLDTVQLFARSGDREHRVAGKSGVGELKLSPVGQLALDPESVELREHLQATTFGLLLRGSGQHPAADVRLEVTVSLRAEVQVF